MRHKKQAISACFFMDKSALKPLLKTTHDKRVVVGGLASGDGYRESRMRLLFSGDANLMTITAAHYGVNSQTAGKKAVKLSLSQVLASHKLLSQNGELFIKR